MPKALVTGGCGLIGSHLVEELVRRGYDVTVFDSGTPPRDQSTDGIRYVPGDIRDADRLAKVLTEEIDVVYHMAAMVGVDKYIEAPLEVIEVNLMGTRNILERVSAVDAKVVLASTSEVFGMNPRVPWREDDERVVGSTAVDRWTYSSSKALAEHLAFAYVRARGLRMTILRYFNVYGPRQRPAFVVSKSVHRALNGRPPLLFDRGEQTRCFTYVADAIRATVMAGETDIVDGECFNVGSSVENTIADVVRLISELTGFPVEPVAVDTKQMVGTAYQDLPRRVPDTTKIRNVLGWELTTDLRTGLARTIEWARANPTWLAEPDHWQITEFGKTK